ncbi:MAG: hypothetical protein IJ165_06620 [Proteobacteria bacterium]|nr:hypothetical protein [Pseudomonadota bacterium]
MAQNETEIVSGGRDGAVCLVIDEADLRDIMVEDYAIVQCFKGVGGVADMGKPCTRQNAVAGDGIEQGRLE